MSIAGRKVSLTFCHICKKDVKYFNRHLVKHHSKISQLDYFNTYIRTSEQQGFCKTCGKPTTFFGPIAGFATYCDAKCQMTDPDMQQKYCDNYKAKTGYEHNFKNPKIIKQIRQTQIEKYGGIGFASEKIRKKALNGIDNCMHNPATIEKVKTTRLNNNNGKWCSDKQLEAICEANKQPEKYIKAKHTRYEKYNGKYISDIATNNAKLTAIDRYSKYIKFIKFNYNDLCECECLKCHKQFSSMYSSIRTRILANVNPCTFCVPQNYNFTISNEEKNLLSFIKTIYADEIIEHDRTVLNGKELDIYIPEKKLAFEFDGLFWHNELHKANNYHVDKTNMCEQAGIQLIHIFEDEWLYKTEIVKSRIKGLLSLNDKIYARKCSIQEVNCIDSKQFLNNNHIQGSCVSKYNYGLYYNDELVSLMTFGKSRFKKDEFELLRFCNKLHVNIIGGASKLLKHFLKDHPEIKTIVSYADRRWSKGNVYEKLGFKLVGNTKPNYFYIENSIRNNRILYQKHKLVEQGFNSDKSEHEIMLERKIYRIYDCGNLKYSINNPYCICLEN